MKINGKEICIVSVDVFTSDKDADHRIFARPVELQENSDDTYTLLCEKTEDNYEIIKKLKEEFEKDDSKLFMTDWVPCINSNEPISGSIAACAPNIKGDK